MALNTIKDRVLWIYSNHKDAVETDACLISMYSNYFGDTRFKEDAIKRAGRYWRYNGFFQRSYEKVKADQQIQDEFLEVFVL